MSSTRLPERNPITHQYHRREVLWQITVPLLLGVLVFVVLAVLAFLAGGEAQSLWADVALIWILLPMLLFGLVLLVVVSALAFLNIWLVRKIPTLTLRVQDLFATIGEKVKDISDIAVKPILRAQEASARWRGFRRGIRREFDRLTRKYP